MKKFILTGLLLTASYGFAAEPPQTPSLEGTWIVTSRACSGNSAINDGIKIGQDVLKVTQRADQTFEYHMNVAGCETVITGTYELDGMLATYTSISTKSCKDTSPIPTKETYKAYFAYLSSSEAVTVTTGDKAAMTCPAGEALIAHYAKDNDAE